MFNGIGYQQYKQMRIDEGIMSSKIEKSPNERFLVYFGRYHITDHKSNEQCRGHLKIGRGKFATALMRGRNQPGGDFRIYGEIIFNDNRSTEIAENIIKNKLFNKNIKMSQGQRELYYIHDEELEDIIKSLAKDIRENSYCEIKEIKLYKDSRGILLDID